MSDRRASIRERAWAAGSGGRPRRLSETDLRERILGTAVAMLTESGGLTVSMAHLNMEELIRIADVPRSSVYRTWGSKEAFHLDLMERMLEPGPDGTYADEVAGIARAVLSEHRDRLGSPEGRRAVFEELVRCTITEIFYGASRSLAWRSFTALAVALPTLDPAGHDRILAALATSHAQIIGRVADLYTEMIPTLGMRMKDGFDVRTLAATGSSVMDGLIRLSLTDPITVASRTVRTGIDGQPIGWELPAVAFLAIMDAMAELDPDFRA